MIYFKRKILILNFDYFYVIVSNKKLVFHKKNESINDFIFDLDKF